MRKYLKVKKALRLLETYELSDERTVIDLLIDIGESKNYRLSNREGIPNHIAKIKTLIGEVKLVPFPLSVGKRLQELLAKALSWLTFSTELNKLLREVYKEFESSINRRSEIYFSASIEALAKNFEFELPYGNFDEDVREEMIYIPIFSHKKEHFSNHPLIECGEAHIVENDPTVRFGHQKVILKKLSFICGVQVAHWSKNSFTPVGK